VIFAKISLVFNDPAEGVPLGICNGGRIKKTRMTALPDVIICDDMLII